MNKKETEGFTFNGDPIIPGMRFYTMISDDEYKILTFFKFNDRESGQFLNEETGDYETLLSYTLNNKYTLLTNYHTRFIAVLQVNGKREFLFDYDEVLAYLKNNPAEYSVVFVGHVATYPYLTRSVFNNTVNYTLTHTKDTLTDEELEYLQKSYVGWMLAHTPLIVIGNKINIQECLESKDRRVPDSVIMDAEKELDTFILSYEIYEYDESVDFNKVNMKYFMIYNNDKYYIVLYMIDTARQSADTIQAMKENVDVIEFMLGKS